MNSESQLQAPIIIVGAPRSGTSVLGRLVSKHPQVVSSVEPRLVWRFGNDGKSDAFRAEDARPEVKAHIRSYFQRFVEESGKERLLEKTPSNSLRVPFVRAVFPDCKIVHILRNGFDSTLSIYDYWHRHTQDISYSRIEGERSILKQRLGEMHPRQMPYYAAEFAGRLLGKFGIKRQNLWGPRFPGMRKILKETDVLTVAALQWRVCVEMACAAGRKLPPEDYMEVRLEELGREKLEAIAQFCGLDFAGEMEDYFTKNFKQSMSGERSKRAEPGQLEQIAEVIAPTMNWLGYDSSI